MSGGHYRLQMVLASVMALASSHVLATPFTFNEIDCWVGNGANRAALVIDWFEDNPAPPALAWGYRWDGTATGYDMLLAIVTADDRLFAKLGEFAEGTSLYGLGYDVDNDGQFGARKFNSLGQPIDTMFDEAGIAQSGIPDQDGRRATATDPGDYYAEGWFTAAWHYGNETEVPIGTPTNPFDGGSWEDGGSGMLVRELKNGSWDSWVYEIIPPMPPFNLNSYAENPSAAASTHSPGDFNRDEIVDEADYQLWKNEFGSTSAPEIDASNNGVVDAADFTIWRDHLSMGGVGSSITSNCGVPEPSTLGLASGAVHVLWLLFFSRMKETF